MGLGDGLRDGVRDAGTFGVVSSAAVQELVAAIKDYLRHHNADPKSFVWSTTCRHHSGQGQEV